jgi:hypothetical protein
MAGDKSTGWRAHFPVMHKQQRRPIPRPDYKYESAFERPFVPAHMSANQKREYLRSFRRGLRETTRAFRNNAWR